MNESTPDRSDRVLLRASDVGRWREEIDKLQSQRKDIDDQIQQLNQKLAAAAFLAKSDPPEGIFERTVVTGTVQETRAAWNTSIDIGNESMPNAAELIILNAGKTLSHAEIQSALKEKPDFRDRLNQNPNYYYTIIGRLLKRKRIAKRGRKFGPPSPKNENARDANHA